MSTSTVTERLWCVVDDDSISSPFTITLPGNINMLGVKMLIKEKKLKDLVDASELILWKVKTLKVSEPVDPDDNILHRIRRHGDLSLVATRMSSAEKVSTHFANPPADQLHIFVQVRRTAPLKRPGSLEIDDSSYTPKKSRAAILPRKWCINGTIREVDLPGHYCLDPGLQPASEACLRAVQRCQFVLLSGARASGKSTRLLWLQRELTKKGYVAVYISFERIDYSGTVPQFWDTIGRAIQADIAGLSGASSWTPAAPIVSQQSFLDAFRAGDWQRQIVLLIDELSELLLASGEVQNTFLRTLREARNHSSIYAIKSTIGAGTFSILRLNPTNSSISPFNISDPIDNQYFTVEETRKLFQEFAQDAKIAIDDGVIVDIWDKSSGHPGMVSLCGRIISDNLQLLLKHSSTLSYQSWQQFPTTRLYDDITAYSTFRSMRNSLLRDSSQAEAALRLLRFHFAGYLDNVQVSVEAEDSADFLTAEGVLLRPIIAQRSYKMASPLIDGYIRTAILPRKFRHAPSIPLPIEDISSRLRVMDVLIESLKYFDKETIRLAALRSYKISNVRVRGKSQTQVPRESVYDTELMGILSNWVQTIYGWTVTGQWHLRNPSEKHKYTNIVIKKGDDLPIVLEILATGNRDFFRSHVEKTPEYMDLVSANEAWVVHFTCEDDFHPIWQSDTELAKGVNIVHFWHDLGFEEVRMSARFTDATGHVKEIVNRLL